MASGTRIFELMDLSPTWSTGPAARASSRERRREVRGLEFHYVEDEPVLQGVDLHVPAGNYRRLVGPTGAGKTTIVSLLMRFYDGDGGRVLIDGVDIRTITLDSLSKQRSIVPQEPYLFGTIADNIRYNRTEATDEDVVKAATAVGAHDFHHEDGERYDTPCRSGAGISA